MATQTQRIFDFDVIFTDVSLTLSSRPTGAKKLSIEFAASDKAALTSEERDLLVYITGNGDEGKRFVLELSANDCALLVRIRDKCKDVAASKEVWGDKQIPPSEEPQAEQPPPEEEEDETPAPTAPTCPLCHGEMKRMSSNKGWRCSRAGRYIARRKSWSGCNGVRWDNEAVPETKLPAQTPVAPKTTSVSGTVQESVQQLHTKIQQHRSLGGGVVMCDSDEAEKRIGDLQQLVKATQQEFILFFYWIPSALQKECPNPSYFLWGLGARLDGSVWLLRKDALENRTFQNMLTRWRNYATYTDANGMNHGGVTSYVVPQSKEQMATLRQMAIAALDQEIRNNHTSLIQNLSNADEALKKALESEDSTTKDKASAQSKRDGRYRQDIRQARKDLECAIKCAELFDAHENVDDLIEGLRKALSAQEHAFNADAQKRGVKQV